KFFEIISKFALKFRIALSSGVFLFQLLQRMHQRLGYESATIRTEMAKSVRDSFNGNCAHAAKHSPRFARSRGGKNRCFTGSSPMSRCPDPATRGVVPMTWHPDGRGRNSKWPGIQTQQLSITKKATCIYPYPSLTCGCSTVQ